MQSSERRNMRGKREQQGSAGDASSTWGHAHPSRDSGPCAQGSREQCTAPPLSLRCSVMLSPLVACPCANSPVRHAAGSAAHRLFVVALARPAVPRHPPAATILSVFSPRPLFTCKAGVSPANNSRAGEVCAQCCPVICSPRVARVLDTRCPYLCLPRRPPDRAAAVLRADLPLPAASSA